MTSFKHIEQTVTELVNTIDPDNLTNYGAPADEYSSQVHRIISLLSKNKQQDEWESEIYKLFFASGHEPTGAKEKIKRLTEALKELFPQGLSVQE